MEIFSFSEKWKNSHTTFAKKHFNNRRKRVNEDYISWKFGGLFPEEPISLLLAIENDNVIGQLGLVPCKVQMGAETVSAHWACDLMVDLDYRGKGVANLLYKEGLKNKLTFGSDPSPAADKSMRKAGFEPLIAPWKFFLPLKLSAITKKKFKKLTPIFEI